MRRAPRSRRSLGWWAVALWLAACPVEARETARLGYGTEFDLPPGLEARVQHWIDIFTRYSLGEAVVHDRLNPEYVLAVVPLPTGRTVEMREVEGRYQELIQQVAGMPSFGTNPFLHLFQTPIDPRRIADAVDRVRVQPGQREVFAKSLVRSRRYLPQIRRELERLGLPKKLAYLPHVESSFNTVARSPAGAVGLWQLMPDTARPMLRVDDRVDERTHPRRSTQAAAHYLQRAYDALGTWPLAITAYNYGLNGTLRAVKALGSTDVMDVIERHDGGSFGFACRNFYAQFLAAVHVAENAGTYFPELVTTDGIEHVVREGDTLWDLSRHYGVPIEAIRRANMLAREARLKLGQRLLIQG